MLQVVRRLLFCVAIILSFSTYAIAEKLFSRAAIPITDLLGKSQTIPSPDKKVRIVAVRDRSLTIEILAPGREQHFDLGPAVGAELLWSPDSSAFVVTSSSAGLSGPFTVRLFVRDPKGGFREVDLTSALLVAIRPQERCDFEPNLVAIRWMAHRELLIAAQRVHYASMCDSAETFVAYRVRVRDVSISRTYGQLEAKRLFRRHLGRLLRLAPDKCVKLPEQCRTYEPFASVTDSRSPDFR